MEVAAATGVEWEERDRLDTGTGGCTIASSSSSSELDYSVSDATYSTCTSFSKSDKSEKSSEWKSLKSK